MSWGGEKECAKLLGVRSFKGKQDEEQHNGSLDCRLAKEHTWFEVFSYSKALDASLVVSEGLKSLLDSKHTNNCNNIVGRAISRLILTKEIKHSNKVACLFELWKEAERISCEEAGRGEDKASVCLVESMIVVRAADT